MQLLNILKKELDSAASLTGGYDSGTLDTTGCSVLSFQVNVTNATGLTGSFEIDKSDDGVTWFTDGTASSVTGDGVVFLEATQPVNANYYKLAGTVSNGSLDAECFVLGKGFV